MPQFMVCRNKNPQTLSAVPFLLDVQNDLLSDLETRVEQYRFEIIAAIDFLLTGI
ncbi:MAG TPA: hypothetical protein VHC97_23775 [Thermoanaerobaculia bacterium]|jgi:hypothetical protein|nr:hypothetical protein [Thermoanaerobaculia bacterium]